jgi:hypothetical protein
VDSRVPKDSLGRGDGSKGQGPKDTGAVDVRKIIERARVSEVETTEAVHGNHDMSYNASRCGSCREGFDGDDDL